MVVVVAVALEVEIIVNLTPEVVVVTLISNKTINKCLLNLSITTTNSQCMQAVTKEVVVPVVAEV